MYWLINFKIEKQFGYYQCHSLFSKNIFKSENEYDYDWALQIYTLISMSINSKRKRDDTQFVCGMSSSASQPEPSPSYSVDEDDEIRVEKVIRVYIISHFYSANYILKNCSLPD